MTRTHNLTLAHAPANREALSFQHTTLEALFQKTTVNRGGLADCERFYETAWTLREQTTN